MKFSLLLSALILAVGWFFYQRTDTELAQIRAERALASEAAKAYALDLEAASVGQLKVDGALVASHQAAQQRSAEASKEAAAHAFAQELISLALKMKDIQKQGIEPDKDLQEQIIKTLAKFTELDASTLSLVLKELNASQQLDKKTRGELLGFSGMMLAQQSPDAALRLTDEIASQLSDNDQADQIRSIALVNLMKQDAAAALAWLDRPESKEFLSKHQASAVLAAYAQKDLKGTLQRIVGSQANNTVQAIAKQLDEKQVSQLMALTGTPEYEKFREPALKGLGSKLAKGSVAQAAQWLDAAALPAEDMRQVLTLLSNNVRDGQAGEWLGLISQKETDPEALQAHVKNIVEPWTYRDFNAVGEWLNVQPEGPLREHATHTYAERLSSEEPAAAAVWAKNLPDSPKRTDLLKKIFGHWEAKDASAAKAAKEEYFPRGAGQ